MGLFWIAPALLTACERKPAAPVLGLVTLEHCARRVLFFTTLLV